MSKFTHLDDEGKAQMVDISGKSESVRIAVASGAIMMAETTLDAIRTDSIAKGDVLSTARIAGIMAAKKTSELIPLCHPLSLDQVMVDFDMASEHIVVTATARITGKTGVEMEALTAATTALLTIYDMAKAVQKDMVISDIKLLSKTGGKSGDWSAK